MNRGPDRGGGSAVSEPLNRRFTNRRFQIFKKKKLIGSFLNILGILSFFQNFQPRVLQKLINWIKNLNLT